MWSHYLDTCAFAYNTSQHDSTKFTPFMLMFGRRATLPIDVELEHQDSEDLLKAYKDLEDRPYAGRGQREHHCCTIKTEESI